MYFQSDIYLLYENFNSPNNKIYSEPIVDRTGSDHLLMNFRIVFPKNIFFPLCQATRNYVPSVFLLSLLISG